MSARVHQPPHVCANVGLWKASVKASSRPNEPARESREALRRLDVRECAAISHRHPGQGREATAEPGPIGPEIVRRGPVQDVMRVSAAPRTHHPAALLNGSRVCPRYARLPGMTAGRLRMHLQRRRLVGDTRIGDLRMTPASAICGHLHEGVIPAERSESRDLLVAGSCSAARSSPPCMKAPLRFIAAAFLMETGRAAQWVPGLSSLRSVARDDGGGARFRLQRWRSAATSMTASSRPSGARAGTHWSGHRVARPGACPDA